MHAADLADVAELLPEEQVFEFLAALPPARAADVLEYLDEELRAELLEKMSTRQAAELVTQMTPDDRADTLEEIDEERAEEILSEIPAEEPREKEQPLSFAPDTGGRLIDAEVGLGAAAEAVEQALEGVRSAARSGRREAMYAVYVTDEAGRLV